LDYTNTPTIERELLLAKVSILGPEFAQSHLFSSPTHADSTSLDHEITSQDFTSPPPFIPGNNNNPPPAEGDKIQREQALARTFESSGSNGNSNGLYPSRPSEGMSASEALIAKNLHMTAIKLLVEQFGGKVVDVAENSVIVEITAKSSRVDAFLSLMRPFGVLEAARSGRIHSPSTDQH
jgi:acetolactate synthase-1/3 small subunit